MNDQIKNILNTNSNETDPSRGADYESDKVQAIGPALQYTVLPLRNQAQALPLEIEDLKCEAFRAWRDIWGKVFAEVGAHTDLSADEFLRHDYCAVIHKGNKIAAVHLYTVFQLERPIELERRFLTRSFTPQALNVVQERGHANLMSLEYLTVTDDFRSKSFGYSLPIVLISLALDVFRSNPRLDCAIGCTRNTRKINVAALKIGVEEVETNVMIHGEASDVFIFDGPARPELPDNAHEELVAKLWATRRDFRNINEDQINESQKGVLHVA